MQVVVITGLAQGIGREVARLLAASGTSVAGFDVDDGSDLLPIGIDGGLGRSAYWSRLAAIVAVTVVLLFHNSLGMRLRLRLYKRYITVA